MINYITRLTVLCLLMFFSQGCKNWHSLQFETSNQPIQFGPHHSSSAMDSLGMVTGYTKYDFEEDTYSATENTVIMFSGDEYLEENLNETIYRALDDHPDHFIADGRIIAEVRYGVTLGAVLAAIFSGMILGPDSESEIGTYSEEHIYYNGMVYKISKTGGQDE